MHFYCQRIEIFVATQSQIVFQFVEKEKIVKKFIGKKFCTKCIFCKSTRCNSKTN